MAVFQVGDINVPRILITERLAEVGWICCAASCRRR